MDISNIKDIASFVDDVLNNWTKDDSRCYTIPEDYLLDIDAVLESFLNIGASAPVESKSSKEKKIEVKILREDYAEDLAVAIQDHLNEGWVLSGNMVVSSATYQNKNVYEGSNREIKTIYCQQIIRR